MGVCAVGAWLVRCMWLGMLANKTSYKTTIFNVVPPPRDHPNFYNTSALDDAAQGYNTTTNKLDKFVENLFFDSAAADRATRSSKWWDLDHMAKSLNNFSDSHGQNRPHSIVQGWQNNKMVS